MGRVPALRRHPARPKRPPGEEALHKPGHRLYPPLLGGARLQGDEGEHPRAQLLELRRPIPAPGPPSQGPGRHILHEDPLQRQAPGPRDGQEGE